VEKDSKKAVIIGGAAIRVAGAIAAWDVLASITILLHTGEFSSCLIEFSEQCRPRFVLYFVAIGSLLLVILLFRLVFTPWGWFLIKENSDEQE